MRKQDHENMISWSEKDKKHQQNVRRMYGVPMKIEESYDQSLIKRSHSLCSIIYSLSTEHQARQWPEAHMWGCIWWTYCLPNHKNTILFSNLETESYFMVLYPESTEAVSVTLLNVWLHQHNSTSRVVCEFYAFQDPTCKDLPLSSWHAVYCL